MTTTRTAEREARPLAEAELCAIEERAARFKAFHVPPGTLGDFALALSDLLLVAAEVRRLRVKKSELNRRCQQAEAAARHNVEECRRQGVPLGRYLANWTARDFERQLLEARAALASAEARGAAAEREKVDRLIQDAEAVYVARGDIFSDPNAVHRKIIKMHFVLNELRGLK